MPEHLFKSSSGPRDEQYQPNTIIPFGLAESRQAADLSIYELVPDLEC